MKYDNKLEFPENVGEWSNQKTLCVSVRGIFSATTQLIPLRFLSSVLYRVGFSAKNLN